MTVFVLNGKFLNTWVLISAKRMLVYLVERISNNGYVLKKVNILMFEIFKKR